LRENFGRLSVSSSPQSGLDIYLNDQPANFQTPHTFQRLKPGLYRVKAKSQFYETAEQSVEITSGQLANVQLSSENNFAVLNINTLPNAIIYLNGKKTTQLKNIRLLPALLTVRAEMPPKGKAVEKRVVLKKSDNITIDIKPQIATGIIQVAVVPFDARITLKGDAGELYHSKSSKAFKDIPIGTYRLSVVKQGYQQHSESFNLTEGETVKRSIRLDTGADDTAAPVAAAKTKTKTEAAGASSGSVFLKSMIIPGWGQSSGRSWLYTLGALGLGGWYFSVASSHRENIDAYNEAADRFEYDPTMGNASAVEDAFTKAETSFDEGSTILYALGGLYALNLLDALISSSSNTKNNAYSLQPYIENRFYARQKQPMLGLTVHW
jgi:hypothetical protein